MQKLFLNPYQDKRIEEGSLWVFSNQIERLEKSVAPGSLIDVYSHRKKFLGRGFYNPHSLIAARILTFKEEEINADFLARRIANACRLRSLLYPNETAYRLVFGESDFLPGLVIDRYNNCFVIQSYCLGMDVLLPQIIDALKMNFQTECIILKNDSSLRTLENLKEEIKVADGTFTPPIKIQQKLGADSIHFFADPLAGQKSGFFFDQRENRERLSAYCAGKTVLDCFCYSGGFGIYAAKSGAREVTCVDSSAPACQWTRQNFELNGLQASVIQQDVEDALAQFQKQNRKFDIIVLDPPALAKSKKNLFGALRKYKKINESALALLNQGGILFSCSCSHHIQRSDFLKMLAEAGRDQGKFIKVLEMRGASRDHPVLPAMPETEYLKCAVVTAETM